MLVRIPVDRLWSPSGKGGLGWLLRSKSLDSLSDSKLHVLQGSPGVGKTYEIESQAAKDRGMVYSFADLHDKETCIRWLSSASQDGRTLWIDAFDERNSQRFQSLVDGSREVGLLPKLRLISRPGFLNPEKIEELEEVFLRGETSDVCWELQPLSRVDQDRWIQFRLGEQAEAFRVEAEAKGIEHLLGSPRILDAFVKAFSTLGVLGESAREAILLGIKIQLEELSPSRLQDGPKPAFGREQRFAMAKVIAACCSLRGCAHISTNRNLPDFDSDLEIIVDSFRDDFRDLGASNFRDLVEETLRSSLFEWAGDDVSFCTAFEQQVLSSEALSKCSAAELFDALSVQGEFGRRFPSQSRAVTAELCAENEELFDAVLEIQPNLILDSVTATFTPDQNRRLFQRLTSSDNSGEYPWWGQFRGRNFPNLGSEIIQILKDRSRSDLTTWVATAYAMANEVDEAGDALCELALDSTLDEDHRLQAISALSKLPNGSHWLIKIEQQCRELPHEVRSWRAAFASIWPSEIDDRDCFRLIHTGAQGFTVEFSRLLEDIVDSTGKLSNHQVDLGLIWLIRGGLQRTTWSNRFASALCKEGLGKTESSRTSRLLAKLILRRGHLDPLPFVTERIGNWERGGVTEPEYWLDEEARRRILKEYLALRLRTPSQRAHWDLSMVWKEDQFRIAFDSFEAASESVKKVLRDRIVIDLAFAIDNGRIQNLDEYFGDLHRLNLDPESILAQVQLWKNNAKLRQYEPIAEGFDLAEHKEEIKSLLAARELESWPKLCAKLVVTKSGFEGYDGQSWPANGFWTELDEDDRSAVVQFGKDYLTDYDQQEDFPGALLFTLSVTANIDSNWLRENASALERSLIYVLEFCAPTDREMSQELKAQLKRLDASKRAGVIVKSCIRLADEYRSNSFAPSLGWLVDSFVARELQDAVLGSSSVETWHLNLLDFLLSYEVESAEAVARHILASKSSTLGIRVTDLLCSRAKYMWLIDFWDDQVENQVYEVFRKCIDCKVFCVLALPVLERFLNKSVIDTPQQKRTSRSGAIPPEDYGVLSRDSLIHSLCSLGREDAWDMIERFGDANPEFNHLRLTVRRYRLQHQEDSWRALTIPQIAMFLREPSRVAVRSSKDLQVGILKAIALVRPSFENSRSIWQGHLGRQGKEHQTEVQLTEHLYLHLKPHLPKSVSFTEVEQSADGRLDIVVETETKSKCIIECKGDWNAELFSAIDDQLVGKYLSKELDHVQGIYLVYAACKNDGPFGTPEKRVGAIERLNVISSKYKGRVQVRILYLGGCPD